MPSDSQPAGLPAFRMNDAARKSQNFISNHPMSSVVTPVHGRDNCDRRQGMPHKSNIELLILPLGLLILA